MFHIQHGGPLSVRRRLCIQKSNTARVACASSSLIPQLPGTHSLSCALCTLQVNHDDFYEGMIQVQAKKKANLSYYA